MSELAELTAFAINLAQASGAAILPYFRQNIAVENKLGQGWDPVTEGDKSGERAIRALIEQHYPSHGIVGEEYGTKQGSSAYTWILDPVDGTRAFVIGMPTWTTLIGLYRDGKPYLGLMHQPHVGELFYGTPEGAFFTRGSETRQIKCAKPKPLAQALAGTTTPHLFEPETTFHKLRKSVRLMRYGGDAYFFSLLAAGHLDLALDAGLQTYDIAALIPIVRGAGAIVGTWDGTDETQGGNILAASCQSLFDQAKEVLSEN